MSETPTSSSGPAMGDHDALLRSNLDGVFNEREAGRRAAGVAALYVADPVMYEPDAVVSGRTAIAEVAGRLQVQFGPDFRFVPVGRATGHHGIACLRWQAGPAAGPVVVTGADVAEIVEGRIARLWVLLDPPPAAD
ncbi:hypothetical protein J2X65_002242 [Ancylobacter sp. 3268]|uniref:nuclear transport factor 2 family protein n=1 Tax=Ancylobacter sp. 3268 TaxID=2817752 RepID=UPI002864AFE7|nr:nuclear transport factor 2 family protein [Ancylobacter sp. 3268]MDR6952883.1 hypothetical protein [Ancylobacter sp. 3268]